MQVKTIYNNNAPNTYGVFPETPSRFDGKPLVRFGTPPIALFDNELDAWNYLNAHKGHKSRKRKGVGRMKEVTIKIECGNAAFEPRAHDEIARILRDLADKFERGAYITNVWDVNGNKVGTVDAIA